MPTIWPSMLPHLTVVFGCDDDDEANYLSGIYPPRYPVPALRRDICYWDCGGISINTVGECLAAYTYGKAFGNGVRMNPWEP